MTAPTTANDCLVSVIVPTYCEAENIPILVPSIADALNDSGISGEIIIVDDDSPDDTKSVCDELAGQFPIRLEVRKGERGLSSAVILGMKRARGAIFVVIDADLSHPTQKIPELVAALQSPDVDFVIGSRYVRGGSTDENWGLFRWLNSKAATLMARPLTKARDPMAGFFAIRRDDFQKATRLDPVGYKIGLELMVKCACRNIQEIPISFSDRLHGESKLSFKEQLNYLRHLKRLYEYKLGRLAQPMMFAMVGSTGMIIDLIAFVLLMQLMSPYIARALAIWCAMSWNFIWNRRITFSAARRRPVLHQYVLFCLSCLLGALLNWSVFTGLHANISFFQSWPLIAALIGIVCGFIFDFLLSKHVAFK